MTPEELETHVNYLCEKIGDKASRETIQKELEKYVFDYKIPIDSARNGILKKYSNPSVITNIQSQVTKKIRDLQGDEMNVNIIAKMVFVESKTINTKNGQKEIVSGIAGDDTGTLPFTIWMPGNYEKGKVYTFKNAYTNKYRDQVQINVGNRGKVQLEEGVDFNVISTPQTPREPTRHVQIGEITDKMSYVTVTAKVLDVSSRLVNIRGNEQTVYGGMMADSTGKIQYSDWENHSLEAGKVYTFENANIRTWKGIPQLNIGVNSVVTEVADSIGEIKTDSTLRTVESLVQSGGGLDITIKGTIVDLKQGSGLIMRCPVCKRALINGECSKDGMVENPVPDLRIKTTLDDGTGQISLIIGREDTEKLANVTLESALTEYNALGSNSDLPDRIAGNILMKHIEVTGNVMIDEKFGPQMTAKSVTPIEFNIKPAAEALLKEVEGSL